MRIFRWQSELGFHTTRRSRRLRQFSQRGPEVCEIRLLPAVSISGVLFADSNSDGNRFDESTQSDEAPLPFVRVFLDTNGDGVRQPSETKITTTNADGEFHFDDLPTGTYLVALDPSSFLKDSRVTGNSIGATSIVFRDLSTSPFSGTGTPASVVSLDIDNKNGPDLIAVVGTQLVLLKNNGQGGFTQSTIPLPSGINAGNLVVGNFDAGTSQDRGMDLAVAAANYRGNKPNVVVYRNTGGQFQRDNWNLLTLASQPVMLAAGQLDTDAADELVATRMSGFDVFLSPATVTTPSNQVTQTSSRVTNLVGFVEDATIGDFDGVNGNDIAFIIQNPGTLRIAKNNGAGSFSNQQLSDTFNLNTTSATSVTSANLDNTGRPELMATTGDGKLWVLDAELNSLIADGFLDAGPGAAVVESADMDGDGLKDILIQVDAFGFANSPKTTLYRNRGRDPVFDQFLRFDQVERFGATLSLAPPRGFAIADVDQRGGLDWILVDRVNRRLTVRRNQQTAAEVRVVDGETAESIIGVKLPTIFSIAAVSAEKPEGGVGASTPFTFQISRDPRGDNNAASSVRYTVAGSGANPANGADFVGGTLPFGDVFFVAGEEGPKTISVFVQGDSNAEPREEFEVTLSNAVNANIEPAFTKASGIIRSDDAALFMTETPVSKREGQSGTTAFTFIVSRLDGTGTPTVKYNVSGAGLHPAESSDFGTTFPSGSVKFASGKTEVTITINVKGDTLVEDDESVGVYDEQFLLTATSADFVGVTSTKIGTIVNDDASFAISTAIGTLLEGGPGQTPEFVFTVTRTGDISGTASVKYAVDGFVPANTTGVLKAVASDFADGRMPPSDTLKFAANESVKIIRIRIKGDATGEPDKGFRVMLSNNSTGTIIPAAQAFALGRIDDDD